jgi:hypothetical protein
VSGYIVSWTTGDTEEGSSGSALFASDGTGVIGVLSCGPDPATCSNRLSLYSKFADFYSRAAAPILEGVGTTGPFITSVVPDGKNLIVLGLNFDSSAKVFVDGVKQKTLREAATSATRLVAKKAFKKIGNGQTVSVVVKNSDGSESPGVPFFKPGTALVIEQPRNDRPRGSFSFESGRNGANVRTGDSN